MTRNDLIFPSQIKIRGNTYCIPIKKFYVDILELKVDDVIDVNITVRRKDKEVEE